MVRITTIVSALVISAGLAAPAPAQGQADLERAQRENERLRQRQQALEQESTAARQRNEELAQQGEQNAETLRALQERNRELRGGLDAAAERAGALVGSESILKAEFDLERLEHRIAVLRDRIVMLRQLDSRMRTQGAANEEVDPNEYVRVRNEITETEKRLSVTELEVADARLRVEQARRLEALRRGPLVSLDFPGGTMEAFIGAVRTSLGDRPVNVLISENGKEKPLPGVRLESVTVEASLRAAITAAGRGGGGFWNLVTLSSGSDGGAPVYRLEFQPDPRAGGGAGGGAGAGGAGGPGGGTTRDGGGPRQVQVFSINDLITGPLERISPEALLSAIEVGLRMAAPEGQQTADLKFHPDSGLLIVRADEATLRMIREMVSEVHGDLMRRRAEAMKSRSEAMQRENALELARLDLARAVQRADTLQRHLKDATKVGHIAGGDFVQLEVQAGDALAEVERLQLRIKALEEKQHAAAGPVQMRIYTVRPGDTLDSIAERELGDKSHARAILSTNPGLEPRSLAPGQQMRIPEVIDGPRR